MKILFICQLLLFSLDLFCQEKYYDYKLDLDEATGRVLFQKIIFLQSDTAEPEVIFLRSKAWLVKTFKDTPEAIQMEDMAGGQILGKGIISISPDLGINSRKIDMHFHFKVEHKPGKVRITFTDIDFHQHLYNTHIKEPQIVMNACEENVIKEIKYKMNKKIKANMVDVFLSKLADFERFLLNDSKQDGW